ncbi:hypothetical protein [Tepidiforma flava]
MLKARRLKGRKRLTVV